MAVICGGQPPLYRRVRRDRVWAGIALIPKLGEDDRHRLLAEDDDVGDAVRRVVVDGAEVGVEARRQADTGDQRVRVWVHGEAGDVGVPWVAQWEDRDAVHTRPDRLRR